MFKCDLTAHIREETGLLDTHIEDIANFMPNSGLWLEDQALHEWHIERGLEDVSASAEAEQVCV